MSDRSSKTVRLSPKFQVVIPQRVREALRLKPGTRIHVFEYEDRIEFIPEKKMRRMRGFLRGLDTRVPRECDRV